MNIGTAYLPPQNYLAADPLCFGAAVGLGIGMFFGRPVVGCLTGVLICYGCESVVSASGIVGSGSGGMPENISAEFVLPEPQFMVRTAEISESTYLSPDQHSDGEELTDFGQPCRRALPHVRPHPGLREVVLGQAVVRLA